MKKYYSLIDSAAVIHAPRTYAEVETVWQVINRSYDLLVTDDEPQSRAASAPYFALPVFSRTNIS